jgi:hypothetical protein
MAAFHDYRLIAIYVNGRRRELTLTAEEMHAPGLPAVTEIVFHGVEAYELLNDNFQTILSDVTPLPLDAFVAANMERFRAGFTSSGWPTFFNLSDSVAAVVDRLRARGLGAFEIGSALGMNGWVVAERYTTRAAS